MPKMRVKRNNAKPIVGPWFINQSSGDVYREGKKGLCITKEGYVSVCDYSSAAKAFRNNNDYTPLQPGDQIIITI